MTSTKIIRAVSFDIGTKNLCLSIHTFEYSKLNEVSIVPSPKNQEEYNTFLTQTIFQNGTVEFLEKKDITKTTFDCRDINKREQVFYNLSLYLQQINHLLDACDWFIIEQQMKINYTAKCVENHIFAYFINRYGLTKKIILYPSTNKTQLLGAPKFKNKKEIKGWAIVKAKEILALRDDTKTLDFINSYKKQDDFCDTIVQFETIKIICILEQWKL